MSITGETNTEIDELSARFIRDAVPLADQLYHVARRHTCNHADAEDLVQDVMMRAYRNFDQFTDGTTIKGWLLRIMTNSRITGYRTATRRPLSSSATTSTALSGAPARRACRWCRHLPRLGHFSPWAMTR